VLVAWFVGVASAGDVACADPIGIPELEAKLDAAETAFADLDDAGFRDDVNELGGLLLPCVGQAIPPALAARYERVVALQLHGIGDHAGAVGAIHASKARDPEFRFDDAFLPADHPVRLAWDASPTVQRTHTVPEAREGTLLFDGLATRARPKDDPAIVQVLDAGGNAVHTVYLGARSPLPAYDIVPRRRNALLVASGATLAASAATLGAAWGAHGGLYGDASDQGLPAEPILADRARTNALAVTSGVLLVGGVGLGVTAAITGPW
jgi:hypothetical protein